jgi:ATP-binding cassette subfamily B protein
LKSRAANFLGSVETFRRVLGILRVAAPRITLLSAGLAIAEVATSLGVLYAIRALVDTLVMVGEAPAISWEVLWILGGTGLLVALSAGMTVVTSYIRSRQGIMVGEHVDGLVQTRATTIDYGFYESPEYFDTLQRARQSGSQRPAQIVSRGLMATKNALFLLAALVALASIEWRIVPAVLVVVFIILAVRLRYTRSLFDWVRRRAQLERRAGYHDLLMTVDSPAKEIRIGGLADRLRRRFVDIRRQINDTQLEILRRQTAAEFLTAGLGAIVFAGAVGFLVLETAAGRQSVGDLVFFVLLFRRAETSGRELVTNLSQLYDDRLYLSQLFEFLDTKPRMSVAARPVPIPTEIRTGLRFEAVGFRYPGSSSPTLSGIDIVLPSGQVVGLVGENGSGKTSIVKLLLRFYDPETGRITLDGTDIRQFDPDSYRSLFSVIFQDHMRYAFSAEENIAFGSAEDSPDMDRLRESARQSGAADFLEALPDGYQTPLSRLFDGGAEISIGQWQRLALARAFYPRSRFVILDEPTSAIDAQAEARLFKGFRSALGGRGALLISHRLTSLSHVDHIYVLNDGVVVEQGGFRELISSESTFRGLFAAQLTEHMLEGGAID